MTLLEMVEMLPPTPKILWKARLRAMIIQYAVNRGHLNPAGQSWERDGGRP